MWRFLIILCVISCPSSADAIPEIQIDIFMHKDELQCKGTAPPLVLNEEYRVFVKTTELICQSDCSISQQGLVMVTKEFLKDNDRDGYVSTDNKITRPGEFNYECTFYIYNCMECKSFWYHLTEAKRVKCQFTVNVVKPEELGHTANGSPSPVPGLLTATTSETNWKLDIKIPQKETSLTVWKVARFIISGITVTVGLTAYCCRRVKCQPDSDNGAGNQGHGTIPPQAPQQTSAIEPPEYDYVYAHRFRARD